MFIFTGVYCMSFDHKSMVADAFCFIVKRHAPLIIEIEVAYIQWYWMHDLWNQEVLDPTSANIFTSKP